MSRRIVRTYAVANLENEDEVRAALAKETKRKHAAVSPEPEGDSNVESPPKPKRGRPPGRAKAAKIVAPEGDDIVSYLLLTCFF
jgi:hypothetical protein